MPDIIIVTRHPGAIDFILYELKGHRLPAAPTDGVMGPPAMIPGYDKVISIVPGANYDTIQGKIVYGHLPLKLAAVTHRYITIEYMDPPRKGQEYDLEQSTRAGARLVSYIVRHTSVVERVDVNGARSSSLA